MSPATTIERAKPHNVGLLVGTVEVLGPGTKSLEMKINRTLLCFGGSKSQQRNYHTRAQVIARVP
jgi:hypothetical protein